jgi:lipid-A-disaccharide synthase
MPDSAPLIYLVAGEPSGDRLGARLMAALRAETDGAVRFQGVGGTMMAAEGLTSLFPIADLAVMGLAEVLPRLPRILKRIRDTADDVAAARPAALVTIDSPDFTLRVAQRLKGKGIPLIHYVAPSVWAWKAGRARKMAAYLDRVMTLLPFEPPFFTREGLRADFVGHPVLESGADHGDGPAFRARHGIDAAATLLALLPGSRAGEISRHLPILRATVDQLASTRPNLRLVMPTVDHVERMIRGAIADWSSRPIVVTGERDKFDAFAAANGAVAASGTVSLELALAQTPSIIVYRVNPLSAAIARRMVTIDYASLVNILLKTEAVPELLQEKCRPELIAATLDNLLGNVDAAGLQRTRAAQALALLAPGGQTPSRAAARVVLDEIAKRSG